VARDIFWTFPHVLFRHLCQNETEQMRILISLGLAYEFATEPDFEEPSPEVPGLEGYDRDTICDSVVTIVEDLSKCSVRNTKNDALKTQLRDLLTQLAWKLETASENGLDQVWWKWEKIFISPVTVTPAPGVQRGNILFLSLLLAFFFHRRLVRNAIWS
jgi:hypothetical protein